VAVGRTSTICYTGVGTNQSDGASRTAQYDGPLSQMSVRESLLSATLIAGVLGVLSGCTRKPALPAWAVEEYRRAGDDLSKPRIIFFDLGFPAKSGQADPLSGAFAPAESPKSL